MMLSVRAAGLELKPEDAAAPSDIIDARRSQSFTAPMCFFTTYGRRLLLVVCLLTRRLMLFDCSFPSQACSVHRAGALVVMFSLASSEEFDATRRHYLPTLATFPFLDWRRVVLVGTLYDVVPSGEPRVRRAEAEALARRYDAAAYWQLPDGRSAEQVQQDLVRIVRRALAPTKRTPKAEKCTAS